MGVGCRARGGFFIGGEEGVQTADVVVGEGAGHSTPYHFVGLTVDGAGRRDHVATVREQINTRQLLAGNVQASGQPEVEVGQAASGRMNGAGIEQVGVAAAEISERVWRVEVEDDEAADAASDDAERCPDTGRGEPSLHVRESRVLALIDAPRTGRDLRAGRVKIAK